ncbi:MAG TPA: class I SAM-dependent methyltransferase [Solirubrobacteraceae bacterium]|nr:class I SAM-dependent methyltransferase [Solirubrobacteraceae bacterium]
MITAHTEFDPYLHDPLRWGASMVHHSEALLSCLEAVAAKSVAEVGAYAGDLTRVLVHWAAQSGGTVLAVDPVPQPALVAMSEEQDLLELVCETSLDALARIELPDVIILDGDHNYFTVAEELRLIGERAAGAELPLLLFHDVCWPHGRRDDYFDPTQIPAEFRQPLIAAGDGVHPGDPGARRGGLPYPRSAAREGGERNGVLTAVEEFVAGSEQLELAVVPAFFGFAAVWHRQAPWAHGVAEVLKPLDRNPLLGRLEENRVAHIAQEHALRTQLWDQQTRQTRQEQVLRRMLQSSAFSVAERLSKLRVAARIAPGQSVISRSEIRRALDD